WSQQLPDLFKRTRRASWAKKIKVASSASRERARHCSFGRVEAGKGLFRDELSGDCLASGLTHDLKLQSRNRFTIVSKKDLAAAVEVSTGDAARDFQVDAFRIFAFTGPRAGNENSDVGD